MIAGAEALAATLDDAQAAPFASINRSELVEMDDAVRNAVNGLIGGLGGEIVKHEHGGVVLGEVVFEREDLAAVAQGALGQKPDLGQAVDHDTLGLQPLYGLEYPLDRFAELEIRGVKKALVLVRIKNAFGRDQLEYLDCIPDGPTVRPRAVPQLLLGFSKADVNPDFADLSARQQELQRDRCLAGAGATLQEVKAVAGQPPSQNAIKPGDAG